MVKGEHFDQFPLHLHQVDLWLAITPALLSNPSCPRINQSDALSKLPVVFTIYHSLGNFPSILHVLDFRRLKCGARSWLKIYKVIINRITEIVHVLWEHSE